MHRIYSFQIIKFGYLMENFIATIIILEKKMILELIDAYHPDHIYHPDYIIFIEQYIMLLLLIEFVVHVSVIS